MISRPITETKVVEDTKDKSIDVYPNPSSSYFVVYDYSGELSRKIELMDLNGRLVRKLTAMNVATKIAVNDLANGIYVLKVTDAKGKVLRTEKIVVQK
jgi:Secretion system C-terminal sorting domain